MPTPQSSPVSRPLALTEMTAEASEHAIRRYQVLRPHLDDGVPLTEAARMAGVPLRTVQRWLARYRSGGLAGLARTPRSPGRQSNPELVRIIEGLALRRPRPSIATIHRRTVEVADEQGWARPSYSTVYAIIAALDPALLTLAHHGPAALRDRYELVYRRTAARPNQMWQADHTQLDLLILDPAGRPARPWLTVILDDHSRAVTGYTVMLGAPSALGTSLALRQAIWTKPDPGWPMCGIPDILYVDHGSDFTSDHLTQVAIDLKIQLIHSTVARPQGRGKIERFFGTVTTELLPQLPGHLGGGRPTTPPALTLTDLDRAISRYLTTDYHPRRHRELRVSPQQAWLGDGWLPRMPDSLEHLDLLLATVARPRIVHRDGIHFQGLRYLDPTLAAYVREPVTIRYDPRDITEIRVFHRGRFLCKAVSPDHAGKTISLKDIETARRAHRRRLRAGVRERIAVVADYLPHPHPAPPHDQPPTEEPRSRLRTYMED